MQGEHPEEDQLRERRPEQRQREQRRRRLPARARSRAAGRARAGAGSARRRASSPRRAPARPCPRRRAGRRRRRSRRRATRGRPRARRRSPSQPPLGWIPVTTATPTIPIASPSARVPLSRSCGSTLSTISALKIGTDAWTTAARPESMCCSPQAISQNGKRRVERAEHEAVAPRGRAARRASRSQPSRQTTYASRTAAASSVRAPSSARARSRRPRP